MLSRGRSVEKGDIFFERYRLGKVSKSERDF